MGKIACICGKKGRVQHKRMMFLKEHYLDYLDVFHSNEDVPTNEYGVIYYTHYNEYNACPFGGTKLASVTSHKYDIEELKKFDGISVNNKYLMHELKEVEPVLTENGVDTEFWNGTGPKDNEKPVIGWVGLNS